MIKFKELVETIYNAATIANDTMLESHQRILNEYFVIDENGNHDARTVTLNYPVPSKNGAAKFVEVVVPLITLVPINTSKIESIKFSSDLDIALKEEELMISFAKKDASQEGWFKKQSNTVAQIELVVKPAENAEGLSKLIEGYEKVLRAQIPG